VKGGRQDIGVAFLNTSYVANEDLVHRPGASTFEFEQRDAIRILHGAASGEGRITGPYNATGLVTRRAAEDFCLPPGTAKRKGLLARSLKKRWAKRKRDSAQASGDNELACAQKIISNLVRHAFRRPATTTMSNCSRFLQQGLARGVWGV